MGVGHHYVPGQAQRNLIEYLSAGAQKIFEQGITGNPNNLDHGNRRYGPLKHSEYNEIVERLTREYIEELRRKKLLVDGKMTGAQAQAWLERIKANGAGNTKALEFNRAVLQSLKLASLAGILASSMLNDARGTLTAMKETPYFKRAHEALLRGDLATAHKNLVGEDHSLYQELVDRGFPNAALRFRDEWLKAERRAADWRYETMEP
jgi:hypothetical protein